MNSEEKAKLKLECFNIVLKINSKNKDVGFKLGDNNKTLDDLIKESNVLYEWARDLNS